MRMKDVTKTGSWADLRVALDGFCDRYDQMLELIRSSRGRTDRHLVLFNLCARNHQELDRLRRSLDEPSEVLAWVARNLFELNLIIRFILISNENLQRWMGEMAGDEKDILQGVLGLSDGSSKSLEAPLQDRIAAIDGLLKRHGLQAYKPLNTRQLAESVNLVSEYLAFFKLYSKYVHPSSWLLNAAPSRREEWKGVFAMQAQLYAGDSFVRLQEALGLSNTK